MKGTILRFTTYLEVRWRWISFSVALLIYTAVILDAVAASTA